MNRTIVFSKEETGFLNEELGTSFVPDVRMEYSIVFLDDIRMKCFDIEIDELPSEETEEWTDRCRLAVTLVNKLSEIVIPYA